MKPLLVGMAVLVVLASSAIGVGLGRRRWRLGRARQALVRSVTGLAGWVAANNSGSRDGMLPAAAYAGLDERLAQDLPTFGQGVNELEPRLLGMALRLELSGQAFRESHARSDLARCREMLEQFQFALADLEQELGLGRPKA